MSVTMFPIYTRVHSLKCFLVVIFPSMVSYSPVRHCCIPWYTCSCGPPARELPRLCSVLCRRRWREWVRDTSETVERLQSLCLPLLTLRDSGTSAPTWRGSTVMTQTNFIEMTLIEHVMYVCVSKTKSLQYNECQDVLAKSYCVHKKYSMQKRTEKVIQVASCSHYEAWKANLGEGYISRWWYLSRVSLTLYS